MPIDTTPSTVATNALQALPFATLIGGPLDAAIKAQAMAAKTSWEFIQQVGLNTDPATGKKEAVNVTFLFNKNGQTSKIIVPLLTIVPIPYIAIDEVQINFKANISASSSSVSETSESTTTDVGGSAKASINYGIFSASAEFKANYSSKKDSKAAQDSKYSVEYTMDVAVHAKQSDMPGGLQTMLNILQSSITEANPKGTFTFSPANPQIDAAADPSGNFKLSITANIKDDNGKVLAGEEVSFTTANVPAGVTLQPVTAKKTDENGNVTFELSGSLAAGSYDKNFDFTMEDTKRSLSASGLISVIGTKK